MDVRELYPTFGYIDDVLTINNPKYTNWIPLIYPKTTWDKGNNRNSFISWSLPQIWHQWSTFYQTLWQKKWLHNFVIINFLHLDIVIYQPLLRMEFVFRILLNGPLSTNLLSQGFIKNRLVCLFVNFFGTKPGHHAVTSFTNPGPAILTWPISFTPCLLISIIKSTKWRFLSSLFIHRSIQCEQFKEKLSEIRGWGQADRHFAAHYRLFLN